MSAPLDPPALARWTVYAICHPATGRPFYIGQSKSFDRRKRQHLENLVGKRSRWKRNYISKLLSLGLVPVFRVLHTAHSRAEAIRLETQEIDRHLAAGYTLTNGPTFRSKVRPITAQTDGGTR